MIAYDVSAFLIASVVKSKFIYESDGETVHLDARTTVIHVPRPKDWSSLLTVITIYLD